MKLLADVERNLLPAWLDPFVDDSGAPMSLTLGTPSATIDQYVDLDLNGFTIDRQMTVFDIYGHVLTVAQGKCVTLLDTSTTDVTRQGKLTGGYGDDGGGVLVGGTFNMTGGQIIGNTAGNGGGGVLVSGTFNMTGGSITGNTARNQGGGVMVHGTSTFNVSGNPVITGNTAGAVPNQVDDNVYLATSKTITVNGTLTTGENGAKIGVTVQDPPMPQRDITGASAAFIGGEPNPATCFLSDDPAYYVVREGNVLRLERPSVTLRGQEMLTDTSPSYLSSTNVVSGDASDAVAKLEWTTGTTPAYTLTLMGANLSIENRVLHTNVDLTILLQGDNTLRDNNYMSGQFAIRSTKSLTIQDDPSFDGTGKLTASSLYGRAISCDGTLTMKGCDVVASGESPPNIGASAIKLIGGTLSSHGLRALGVKPDLTDPACAGYAVMAKNSSNVTTTWAADALPDNWDAALYQSVRIGPAAATVAQQGAPTQVFPSFADAWAYATALTDTATNIPTVKLLADVTDTTNAPASWPISVPMNRSLKLDLNGKTIDREGTSTYGSSVLRCEQGSNVTLLDTSGGHTNGDATTGRITGGYASVNGGGVYVAAQSTFTMRGGQITGNHAVECGGGVYVLSNGSTFTMTGGLITDNAAATGGGVYLEEIYGVTFNVSDAAQITGNTLADGTTPSNVYLPADNVLVTVTDALDGSARVGISVANPGSLTAPQAVSSPSTHITSENAARFRSDDDRYSIYASPDEGSGSTLYIGVMPPVFAVTGNRATITGPTGATLHYTTDGTDPTSSTTRQSVPANGVVALPGASGELKAVAELGNLISSVASTTYNVSQSTAPVANPPSVAKAATQQQAVSFTMTVAPVGTYKVYATETGTDVHATVTATLSGTTLTLTDSGADIATGVYYVSVTEPTKLESARVALTVTVSPSSILVTIEPSSEFTQGNAPDEIVTVGAGLAGFNATNNLQSVEMGLQGAPLVLLTPGPDYTATDGSIIINLHKAYLDTLAAGTYTLRVNLKGASYPSHVDTTIVVRPATIPPKTGDSAPLALWLALCLLGSACMVLIVRKKKNA